MRGGAVCASALVLAAIVAALGGCAGKEKAEVAAWAVVGTRDAWAAGEFVDAPVIRPPSEGRVVVMERVDDAGDGPRRVEIEYAPDVGDSVWTVTRRVAEGADAGRVLSVAHLRLGPNGAVEVTHTEEHSEGVVTHFEPALVILPARFARGEVAGQRVRMEVREARGPRSGRVRMSGEAKHGVTLAGVDTVRWRGAEVEAVRVREVLTADLGLPKVKVETETWYVRGEDGRWRVAGERVSERVTTLGVPVRRVDETWWESSAAR